jgi:hypothetical protein
MAYWQTPPTWWPPGTKTPRQPRLRHHLRWEEAPRPSLDLHFLGLPPSRPHPRRTWPPSCHIPPPRDCSNWAVTQPRAAQLQPPPMHRPASCRKVSRAVARPSLALCPPLPHVRMAVPLLQRLAAQIGAWWRAAPCWWSGAYLRPPPPPWQPREREGHRGRKTLPQPRLHHQLSWQETPHPSLELTVWARPRLPPPSQSARPPGGHVQPSPAMIPFGRCTAQGRSAAAAVRIRACITSKS